MYLVHEKFMDVFVEVLHMSHGSNEAQVRWWNLGNSGNPWLLPAPPSIIQINDEWKVFDPLRPETHPGRSKHGG